MWAWRHHMSGPTGHPSLLALVRGIARVRTRVNPAVPHSGQLCCPRAFRRRASGGRLLPVTDAVSYLAEIPSPTRACGIWGPFRSAPTRCSSCRHSRCLRHHRPADAPPRRPAVDRAGYRGLGGAVRHPRGPGLPRDHLSGGVLRRGWPPAAGVRDLEGRPGHLGGRGRGRGGRLDRRPADADPADVRRRCPGSGAARRAGHRPGRQLVQQRADRWTHEPAVGSEGLRLRPDRGPRRARPGHRRSAGAGAAARSTRPSSTRGCGTWGWRCWCGWWTGGGSWARGGPSRST